MKNWLMMLSVAAALISTGANAAGDAAAGQAKSAVCVACHGPDGNSMNPIWPKIAGQHEGYIVKQLQDFKSGVRTDATMLPMVAALTEEDMVNLAAFFNSQETKLGQADAAVVDLGKKIFNNGNSESGVAACSACHAPNGAGNPAANFPQLAGQHAPYTEKQLTAFRDGTRANDGSKMMQNVAAQMTDEEIKAVSQYIQGLR